jgi:magnesium-transporting ATPase (P-type)
LELSENENPFAWYFLTALAICNTSFIVDEHPELMHCFDYEPKYEGEDADDLVLCQTASNFGVRMIARSAQTVVVRYINSSNTDYEDIQYEILCLLPFETTRKRMSIIVRMREKIYLFIKGAESSIWTNLNSFNDVDIRATTEQHGLDFAQQGYRSLLVACRQITSEHFDEWFRRYSLAADQLNNREEAISEAAVNIEVDLTLAGLTAVEDKLQDGVPKTIATLRCAGIKIWLLTGDKEATALSTAQAASLVSSIHHQIVSDNGDFSEAAQVQLNQRTHMIYYSSQMIETEHERSTTKFRTIENK